MLFLLGLRLHDRCGWVVAFWLAIAMLLHAFAPSWSSVAMDGDLEQLPESTTTFRASRLNGLAFPKDRAASQIVLVIARMGDKLTTADRQYAMQLSQQVQDIDSLPLLDVWTEKTPVVGSQLISSSGQAVRVVLRLTNDFMATDNIRVLSVIRETVQKSADKPSGLQVGITGSAAIGGDLLGAAAASVQNTHRTTIVLVVLILFAIYRSPRLILIPLISIGLATLISLDLLAMMASWSQWQETTWLSMRVFTTTKIFVIVILFGAGTDYCLFLIARYREYLQHKKGNREAIAHALSTVGPAIAASAMTTIVGLAMMGWAQFGKFAYSGPAIAICVLVTLSVCLTFVPALLATSLGQLTWDLGTPDHRNGNRFWPNLWNRLAELILRYPGWIGSLSLLLAIPWFWAGWNTPVTYDLLSELPRHSASRKGTDLMKAHFPPGEIGPLIVLAQQPDGQLNTVEGQLQIAQMVKPLTEVAGIQQIRSLYQPTGDPPGTVRLFSSAGLQILASKGSPITHAAFVSNTGALSGRVTRLYLILEDEPFSPAAVKTAEAVEETLRHLKEDPDSPWYLATFELLGPTAGIRDLERITLADRKRIQWLVTLAVGLVLLILIKRPLLTTCLMGTVLVSYLVTLGITHTYFSWLVGPEYSGLDWKVPLFLFVILTAIGQDYNIYLVTRILEEQASHGTREGLRRAMVHTGGIITSCGVIMAGTFISMTTGNLLGIVELGFALSLGILLDTLVIRSILVPSLIAYSIRFYPEPVLPTQRASHA